MKSEIPSLQKSSSSVNVSVKQSRVTKSFNKDSGERGKSPIARQKEAEQQSVGSVISGFFTKVKQVLFIYLFS